MAVDTATSAEQLAACLQIVRETWSHLGDTQPHFSVLTNERFLPDRIEDSVAAFWDSGEAEAETVIRTLRRMGMKGFDGMVCVEYGCGVGRVTMGLAKHFASVCGYDISSGHLDVARKRAETLNLGNINFDACSNDIRAPLKACDVFYSCIVFQHNPPPVMILLIGNCLTALKKGGIGIFQVPTYGVGYRFDLTEWLQTDHALKMEMHCLPQKTIFELIKETGCEPLEVVEDNWTGAPHIFVSNTFVVRKSG